MKLDTFVQLIKDLRQGAISDDTDPNNVVLQVYTSPYDTLTMADSIRINQSGYSSIVWGDGRTYIAYDSNGNPFEAPSCGWRWNSGGRYS
jgi:hypothetical protein